MGNGGSSHSPTVELVACFRECMGSYGDVLSITFYYGASRKVCVCGGVGDESSCVAGQL